MAERRPLPPRELLPAFPHATVRLPSWLVLVLGALAAVGGGLEVARLVVGHSPLLVLALLLALAGGVLALSDVRAALWLTLGVVTLLPYAVIPIRVGLTLTLFEAGALAAVGVWLLLLLLHREQTMQTGTAAWGVWLFLAVTLFALILGIGRGYTMETFHGYGKFALAVLLFFVVWNATRTLADARRLVTVLLAGAGLAAFIGLVLYAGGAGLTLRVLSRLIPFGYPSGSIVRYIEDNPNSAMRLVSTSVDPNSFGGLLALALVLGVSQFIARRPVVSRWLSGGASLFCAGAVLLTYSRGAWVGAAAGFGLLALLRYRWLFAPGVALALAVLAFGIGHGFVHRFWLGLTLQDPATKLRLQEYQNALSIIRTHPLFGVGFGAAPSIDQQTGVSSIYLSIAERAGFLGVAVFLFALGAVVLAGWRAWREAPEGAYNDLLLGLLAALASALVVGVFDHYYFNIMFPHMAALFWMTCGLILALATMPIAERWDAVMEPGGVDG